MEGQNEHNFLLLQRLLLHSRPVLLAKFESLLPHGTSLQTWKPTAKELKEARLSRIQTSIIKQRSPEQFDTALLIILLRSFSFKSDKNNPLWNETDNDKIQSSGDIADIVRIRNLRNTVCVLFCNWTL